MTDSADPGPRRPSGGDPPGSTAADELEARLAAVERAVADGSAPVDPVADRAATADRLDDLASRLDEVERRLDELDAATQALRGYVGSVRAVNRDVERRADAALAAAEAVADERTRTADDAPTAGDPPRSDDDPDGSPTPERIVRDARAAASESRPDRPPAARDGSVDADTGPADAGSDRRDDEGDRSAGAAIAERVRDLW